MIFKDYYKILELENNKVTIEQIKIAFREQAKKYHPDVNTTKFAEERFKDINEAYRILSETHSRRKYDRIWYSHVGRKIDREKQKQEREIRPDLLTLLFGIIKAPKISQNKKIVEHGENIETQITINLLQAFYGTSKSISLRTVEGKMKTFTVKVPEGIHSGEKMRLIGQGKQGKNGGKNGDLFIRVNIENTEKYKLKGNDIYTNLYITPSEAVFGAKIKIKTIDDEDINIHVPKGIESGEKIRIKQKGYKDGKCGRGDLIAEVKIMIPKDINSEEANLYKKLQETSNFNPRIAL